MPTERTISQVTKYWASYLGCPVEALFASSLHIVTHGPALADYRGVFALFRGSAAIVSIPAERVETFRASLTAQPISPATVADAFRAQSSAVIGPAYIGYAEVVPLPLHAARSLTRDNSAAVTALQAACDDLEWEHGGTALDESPASGVFLGGQLVTLAGYDVWGRTIAHISVITHPEFRG